MFRNYLKIARRNLIKHKAYSFINISGLAIGLSCSLIIFMYVNDELSYDRFHSKADRTYRIAMTTPGDSTRGMGYPRIGGGIAERLQTDFPEIESTVRIFKQDQAWFVINNRRFLENDVISADSTFFQVFDFPVIRGDRDMALFEPFSVLITERIAIKYFGNDDVVGETVEMEFGQQLVPLKITGVLENIPSNSHFHFDHVISLNTLRVQFNNPGFLMATLGNAFLTYFTVPEGYDVNRISSQLPSFVKQHHPPQQRTFIASYFLQPLTDIHLKSNLLFEYEQNGNSASVYILIIVAVMTVLIACINFMNLATARSTTRAREVGVRKVVGAYRSHLIKQFIGESIVVTFVSLLIGLGITAVLLPYFNDFWVKSLSLSLLLSPTVLFGMGGIIILIGIFAGSYPALYLSSFRPVEVFKGVSSPGSHNSLVRKILVIFQFVISIGFIAGTGIILAQLDYIKNSDVGFERFDRINAVLDIPSANQGEYFNKVRLIKQEFSQIVGVEGLSVSSGVPTQLRGITILNKPGAPPEEEIQVATVTVDFDYIPTLSIEILDGRNFSPDMRTDSTQAVILNETAVEQLGLEDPVGSLVDWRANIVANQNTQRVQYTVIGVIKDLHFEPLHRQIAPMMLVMNPNFIGAAGPGNLLVKVNENSVSETLRQMETVWSEIVPQRSFRYSFLDDDFNEQYMNEDKLSDQLTYFALLVIIIACLGLFGLASFTAEQKTKEIGIRKILGASVASLIMKLSMEYSSLIVIAFIIAAPSLYFSYKWLESFYYRVDVLPLFPIVFVLSGLLAFVIAILTVSYQTIKSSLANPVESLRYE